MLTRVQCPKLNLVYGRPLTCCKQLNNDITLDTDQLELKPYFNCSQHKNQVIANLQSQQAMYGQWVEGQTGH